MEPAEPSRLISRLKALMPPGERDFLPDAEELETRPLPLTGRATLYVVLGFLFIAILWAGLSQIDWWVMARGRITSSSPSVPMQAFETSIVRKVLVRAGDQVRKGQALAQLDPTFSAADSADISSRLANAEALCRRLEAELANVEFEPIEGAAEETLQHKVFLERRAEFAARTHALDQEVAGVEAQMTTEEQAAVELDKQLDYLRKIEKMRTTLARKGVGSKLQMIQAQIQRSNAQQQSERSRNHLEELSRDRDRAQAERAAFENNWRQQAAADLAKAQTEHDSLAAKLSQASRRREMAILRAPRDSVVLDVAKLSEGSVVKEAEPIVTLVPIGATLEAEVQVPARDIGFVKRGDGAHVKIDAFPYQKYGILDAKVVVVSEDAFTRTSQNTPASEPASANGTEASYLCRLQLAAATLKDLPKTAKLLPGMTLTAEIVVGHRSVLSYFLYPIFRTLDESIREK